MAKEKEDPAKLTIEEAIKLLAPHKEKKKLRVHSLMGGFGFTMGCDMDLTEVKSALKVSEHICLSGVNMRGVGHGVAYYDSKNDTYVFLQTDADKIKEIITQRQIL